MQTRPQTSAQPIFKVGDKVTSRKTGLPMVGHVFCINDGIVFRDYMLSQGKSLMGWDEAYPDWVNKPVYSVKLLWGPQKLCNYREWIRFSKKEHQNRECYNKYSIVSEYVAYPEDDLEIFG